MVYFTRRVFKGTIRTVKLRPGMEYDGSYLHSAVVNECGSRYTYDSELTKDHSDRHGSRQMIAHFKCTNHSPVHVWHTGILCTELYYKNGYYRTILHAQQCRKCESYTKPEVDQEGYGKKIVSALDLWTGRRDRIEPSSDYKYTLPHDSKRCHGCQIGVCRQMKEQ